MATAKTDVKSFRGDLDFDVTIVRLQQRQRPLSRPFLQRRSRPRAPPVWEILDPPLEMDTITIVIDISDHPDENRDPIEEVSFPPLNENQ